MPSRAIAPWAKWDLGHLPDRSGWTGPEHAKCSRSDGARRGNQDRSFVPAAAGTNVRCRTCGQPYHYAARQCGICGSHYHPSRQVQYTCSRVCGAEYRRRTHGFAGKTPPQPRACEICSKPCTAGQRFCSYTCAGQARSNARQTWPSSRLQHYVCRYCGEPGVAPAKGQSREVCRTRACQLARLRANNLRLRNGYTVTEADVTVKAALLSALGDRRW